MSSSQLRLLEAEPDDSDLDSLLDMDSPDAETALLQDYRTSRDESRPPGGDDRKPPPRHRHYVWVIGLTLCAAFIIELGDFIQRAPTMRAVEDILCQKYYESIAAQGGAPLSLPIPEADCKNAVVQGELATLKGWDAAFSCIPGMLLSLPFGYISDRYGRKIVIIMSLIGVILNFVWVIFIVKLGTSIDIRWIWACNAFLCIGGGAAVVKTAIYAMFADVTPENQRAAVFLQFIAATVVSSLLAVPITWKLMQTSAILGMEVGLGCICCGFVLVLFLPETLERTKASEASADADGLRDDEGLAQRDQALSIVGVLKGSNFILAIPALRLLMITFLAGPILLTSMSFLLQVVSKRYGWTLAEANFVSPFGAVSTLIMLIVVLPLTYAFLGSRFNMRPVVRDLVVARVSLLFVVLGTVVIGLAPTPWILVAGSVIISLGVGYGAAIRSLVTSYVRTDQVSRLFAVIAVIETVCSLIANPIMSKAVGWGMRLGGMWSGVTYLVTAAVVLVLAIPVYIVRPPRPEEDIHG